MKKVLLKSFLPKQLSEDKIVALLIEARTTKGMNMRDAMIIAKALLAGRTDGGTMSKVVKSLI